MTATIAYVTQIALSIPIMLTVITDTNITFHIVMILLDPIRRFITIVHIIVDSNSFCHYSCFIVIIRGHAAFILLLLIFGVWYML